MCSGCKNSGFITATHRETGNLYGFRCTCHRAGGLSNRIPIWKNHFKSTYLPDFETVKAFTKPTDFKTRAADPESYRE